MNFNLNLPYIISKPQVIALFKMVPEDFQVVEWFDWDFSGEGEHVLVRIEKRGLSTEEVLKDLARKINKPLRLISYAGLKDRQALCQQWISIHSPGESLPLLDTVVGDGWKILEQTRHNRKLRPGYLTGNHFRIRLREVTSIDQVLARLEIIVKKGVPNYFGNQRFGFDANNLKAAQELLIGQKKVKDRFLKGLYLSAARSWLFNLILSNRVEDGSWDEPLTGDHLQLQGTQSYFIIGEPDEAIRLRCQQGDLSPASPLPGKVKEKAPRELIKVVDQVFEEWSGWVSGLVNHGVEEAWRSNRLYISNLSYTVENRDLFLEFSLPAGAYATTVLRELVCIQAY